MSTPPRPLMDAEIQMDMFRLMRTGDYRTARALWVAIDDVFPHEPKERLQKCMRALLQKLKS